MNPTMINHLREIIQLNMDLVEKYLSALKIMDIPDICTSMEDFRHDHLLHIKELSEAMARLGEVPPNISQVLDDLWGEGPTEIPSPPGILMALKSMRSEEKGIKAAYKKALTRDFPPEIKEILIKNYEDEKRHCQLLEENLRVLG